MSINDDLFNKEYNLDLHFEGKFVQLPFILKHEADNCDIYYLEVVNDTNVSDEWFELSNSNYPGNDPVLSISSNISNNLTFIADNVFVNIKINDGIISGKIELYSFEINDSSINSSTITNFIYFYPSSFGRINLSCIKSTISDKVLNDFGITNSVIVKYEISLGYLKLDWNFSDKEDEYEKIVSCSDMLAQTLSFLLTFTKASKVEWSHRRSFAGKNLINLKYFKENVSRENKNLTSPFYGQMWDSFISQNFGKYDITFYKSTAIFSSVHLLAINNIDESMYFTHMAALDALTTSHTDSHNEFKLNLISKEKFKKIRNYLISQLSMFFNYQCTPSLNKDESEKVINKFSNIVNITNELSFNEKVKFTFNSLNLETYYKDNEEKIKKAIAARNKIIHSGWVEDWSKYKLDSLVESCFIIREAVQLIILSLLNYNGKFYSIRRNDYINTLTKVGDVKANG